jgi:hypothetical protein
LLEELGYTEEAASVRRANASLNIEVERMIREAEEQMRESRYY